jgi:uncharacterized protein YndB with AHSA1/START domain
MTVTSTDRIEKSVLLRAPRARVWHALVDASAFGRWFGVDLAGAFAPGARVAGRITHKGYENIPFEVTIERMEPELMLSWRWHIAPTETGGDLSAEPTTLVVFELQDVDQGTLLTVVESGFDALPEARRHEAYRGNEQGWSDQMTSIQRHLDSAA